ncbi:sce7726 family protein [Brevibacillus formosus]|uniref:sce7726 family protein n=1 Tax=Brevibacillus formosus TaxID=54913 RepID=UPI001CA56B8A|nr:sce7726 family protein [Brevibacillus formosus]MBW5468475.1 sce7726 family protein [Brevibacillus formosus]
MPSDYVSLIEKNCSANEIITLARNLYSAYQPFHVDVQVWETIKKVFPIEIYSEIEPLKREVVGHKIVNDLVIKHFPGECTIKYHFIKQYLNRSNEVSTFEMNVGSSRLDIGRINGESRAYEIKTELDSLDKLDKQLRDYSRVFDYVYVVSHVKHLEKVKEIAPDHCGIISFRAVNNVWKFHTRKKAKLHEFLDSQEQLRNLTVKEIDVIIKNVGLNNAPKDRRQREQAILELLSTNDINTFFKTSIKKRFQRRWNHLEKNFNDINPIDLQAFFKTEANPYWVYYKNSCMV